MKLLYKKINKIKKKKNPVTLKDSLLKSTQSNITLKVIQINRLFLFLYLQNILKIQILG